MAADIKFIRGNRPTSVEGLDGNNIYFFTDTQEIFMGGKVYGVNPEIVSGLEGEIAALEAVDLTHDAALKTLNDWMADAKVEIKALQDDSHTHANKAVLDGISEAKVAAWDAAEANATAVANQKVASVAAADKSVNVAGTDTEPTVAVAISATAGNAIKLVDDGLTVNIPAATDYTVKVAKTTPEGVAAAYKITQAATGLDFTIDIPKDMVVSSGEVVTNPEGQAEGTYLVLTLANATNDKVYINVANLIEYVTSGSAEGDQIQVAVSADHKVTATLAEGSVTKAQLVADVQASLDKADSAVQPAAIANMATTQNVATAKQEAIDAAAADATSKANTAKTEAVAAAKKYSDDLAVNYATAAQGALADTALQADDITTGAAKGAIAVNGTDVAVNGLGSAAFENTTAFDAAGAAGTAETNAKNYTDSCLAWGTI